MKRNDFLKAIEILSAHHSNELVINKVNPNGQVSIVLESPTIQIKKCVPAVINTLIAEGFTLCMVDGLLSVDKF